MELARITLNLGNAGVRRDIADPYQMHSTLARAFCSDPVATPDKFLWRLEQARADQPPVLMVQSLRGGRWDAFEREVPAWIERRDTRIWNPASVLQRGRHVAFRIRCNPTVTRAGKRLGLWAEEEQLSWFERQAVKSGLSMVRVEAVSSQRLVGNRRKGEGAAVVVCAAQFEGRAHVEDPDALITSMASGIGHSKMMGLGLLSLAPIG
jgi:CRISPR system Cascade subunit CasE